jgi:hypothetical protein
VVATRHRRHRRAARWDVTILRIQDAETIFGPGIKQAAGEPLDGISACSAGLACRRVGSRRAERLQMLYSDGHESIAV